MLDNKHFWPRQWESISMKTSMGLKQQMFSPANLSTSTVIAFVWTLCVWLFWKDCTYMNAKYIHGLQINQIEFNNHDSLQYISLVEIFLQSWITWSKSLTDVASVGNLDQNLSQKRGLASPSTTVKPWDCPEWASQTWSNGMRWCI